MRVRECRVAGCHRKIVGASSMCRVHYLEWRNRPASWKLFLEEPSSPPRTPSKPTDPPH